MLMTKQRKSRRALAVQITGVILVVAAGITFYQGHNFAGAGLLLLASITLFVSTVVDSRKGAR